MINLAKYKLEKRLYIIYNLSLFYYIYIFLGALNSFHLEI